ncbi:MAG: biotin--[acetyl-CoA-carboxylase] ligase [Candidatus Eremiobacteraeota bacterium]|nr:biotin--[acetyl-CoA-carboxylase] ligase [Candidatus Eremiobacteraeota bacterium]
MTHGLFTVRSVAETESTNDDALALLGQPDAAGAVLLADYQRAGRGRKARAWVAPPGSSLLFTTILPRPLAPSALWALTFWTSLGVADGIEAATGIRATLQWPNDLLIDGRKCCGILCVSRIAGDEAWVGCGTGINVTRPAHDAALEAIEPPPAFLSDVVSGVERDAVLAAVLQAYELRLAQLDNPAGIARAWEGLARLAGTPYRIAVDGEATPIDATARRLDYDGSLVVDHDGRERRVTLADARVLR